jgi:hypothetical protein
VPSSIFGLTLAKISNFELIHADVMALKNSDQANHNTRDKLSCKTSKYYLFETVINGLEGKRINASGARVSVSSYAIITNND